ncbi:19412_t:CDS:1, partial [Funneliformis geosporum]
MSLYIGTKTNWTPLIDIIKGIMRIKVKNDISLVENIKDTASQ